MELPLSVTFKGMESSPAIEFDIARQVEKLERRFGRIMSCHVVVDAPHRHHSKGRLYQVSVDLKVPGREIAANSTGLKDHAHEDMHVAIRDAFDALRRRLQAYANKIQSVEKKKNVPMQGHVSRLVGEEGYGFIETSDGQEVYFHRNSVERGIFEKLKQNQEVHLVIAEGEGEKGPQASLVKPLKKRRMRRL